jgi:aspartate racemase
MSKVVGILGGISPASTSQYYRKIIDLYFQLHQNYYYPEIIIYSLDFQKFTDMENAEDSTAYVAYILDGLNALVKAGADFVIMAANSPHAVYDELVKEINVPIISIVEVTARKAQEQGLKKLLLLGIAFTMQSTFYQDVFAKYDMRVTTPNAEQQKEIDDIIFKELVVNNFQDDTRERLLEVIDGYQVDGVILGCTELPLILTQDIAPVILLDTLGLHVEAALNLALET